MKMIRIAGLALLVLAAAAVAGIGIPETAGGAESSPLQGITVNGTGTANAIPNEAQFSLGVTTKGSTAREALAANSARMERVIAALKSAGVSERDIKTQDVSVGPGYDSDKGTQSGYAARNSVAVTLRDLDRSSAVLDAASRAGRERGLRPVAHAVEPRSLRGQGARERFRERAQARGGAGRRGRRATRPGDGDRRGLQRRAGTDDGYAARQGRTRPSVPPSSRAARRSRRA